MSNDIRELGFGFIHLLDANERLLAVLPFVPGVGANDRLILSKPAQVSGRVARADVLDWCGRKRWSQTLEEGVRLRQEHAVMGEPINIVEWTVYAEGAVILSGRGVKYDTYRMEG